MAGRRAPSGASRLGPRCWAPPRHPRAVSLASRRDRGAAGWHSCHGPPVAGNRPPVLAAPSKRCNGRLASTGLLPACSHQKEDSTHSPAPNEPRGLVKRSTRCVGRESNPGQLLGRQLCSPLYHQRRPPPGTGCRAGHRRRRGLPTRPSAPTGSAHLRRPSLRTWQGALFHTHSEPGAPSVATELRARRKARVPGEGRGWWGTVDREVGAPGTKGHPAPSGRAGPQRAERASHRLEAWAHRRPPKERAAASPSGNRTPVSRVTGGDTHHYTNEDGGARRRGARPLSDV